MLGVNGLGQMPPEEREAFWAEVDAQIQEAIELRKQHFRDERDREIFSGKKKHVNYEPMPRIEGHPEWGPIIDDPEDRARRRRERQRSNEIRKQKARANIIRWITVKRHLRTKIAELDPSKKKYSKKRAEYELEIVKLDEMIQCTCMLYGFKIRKVPAKNPSQVERALKYIETKVSKAAKSIKKFCKKHSDTIEAAVIISVPIIVGAFVKRFLGVSLDDLQGSPAGA